MIRPMTPHRPLTANPSPPAAPRAPAATVATPALRRILIMAALTAAVIVGECGLVWLLNPYGATSSTLIDPVFRKIKQPRLATPYLLRETRPTTVLLGSSRVLMGIKIEQGYRDGVLNAAVSAATMAELDWLLDAALKNPRLRRIVWGVDFFAFSANWNHDGVGFERRIKGSVRDRLQTTLLSLNALGDGFDLLKRAIRGRAHLVPTMTATMPWPNNLICREFAADYPGGLELRADREILPSLRLLYSGMYENYLPSPDQASRFRAMVAKIRARRLELYLFVPPMTEYELELIRQSGHWNDFERFKRIVAAAGPLIDFAAYNPMATRDQVFLDAVHVKPSAGNEIYRIVTGLPPPACGANARVIEQSAVRVDEANLERVLADQRAARDRAIATPSRYSRLAATAIAQVRVEAPRGGETAAIGD